MNLEMLGEFSINEIEKMNHIENKYGNYALGYKNDDGFVPKYIGRSDGRLQREIKEAYERISKKTKISHFMYCTKNNSFETYEKECIDYHNWKKQLVNEIHPAKSNEYKKCHICGE